MSKQGIVESVRGSVVDARFPDELPGINELLRSGEDGRIAIETVTHVSPEVVRGIALTEIQGLARGDRVSATGRLLEVPVGHRALGRVMNVFGETIDHGDPLSEGEWRSIHQDPVPLTRRNTSSEVFQTGIKAIDLLAPLERGAKAGLFGVH